MFNDQRVKRIEQGERLKVLLKKLDLNQTKAAIIVQSKQSSISHAIKGKMGIPPVWLYRIKEKYSQINIDWVFSGEGEMETPRNTVEEPPLRYGRITLEDMERLVVLVEGHGYYEPFGCYYTLGY